MIIIRTKRGIMGPPAPHFCITCGFPAPQVYKTYANGNLVKLLNCKSCGELIDKYVEYDSIIVIINLILLNPSAYRHVLLNHAFEGFWKLGVVSLFVEAYCFWCFQKGMEQFQLDQDQDNLTTTAKTDFYEIEIKFYIALLRTFLSTLFFQSMIFLSVFIFRFFYPPFGDGGGSSWNAENVGTKAKRNSAKRKSMKRNALFPLSLKPGQHQVQFSYLTLWKGLCLSSFSVVFKLVALIWSYAYDHDRIMVVELLLVLTNSQCYHATTGISQIKSVAIVAACFAATRYTLSYYDGFITTAL